MPEHDTLINAAARHLTEISWGDTGIDAGQLKWTVMCPKCETRTTVIASRDVVAKKLNITLDSVIRNITCPVCDRKIPSAGPYSVS